MKVLKSWSLEESLAFYRLRVCPDYILIFFYSGGDGGMDGHRETDGTIVIVEMCAHTHTHKF